MQSNSTYQPLKFGILCNGTVLKKWQAQIIEELINSGVAKPVILITDANRNIRTFHKSFQHFIFKAYQKISPQPEAQKEKDLSSLLSAIPQISCKTRFEGRYNEYFEDEDIKTISSYQPDFILRFGFNILKGDILSVAKYGVWSFHHDDEQVFRGGPLGFWEIYENKKVNGVILQRLTDKLDAGIILQKGYYKTCLHCYRENQDNLLYGAVHFPLKVCRDILNNTADYINQAPSATSAPIKKTPTNFQAILFILILIWRRIKHNIHEIFIAEQWRIGIIKKPITTFLEQIPAFNELELLPQEQSTIFKADPSGYLVNNELHILYEKFDYKKNKGIIAHCNPKMKETIFLETKLHLAYPYIFKDKDQYWMIPETATDQCVQLFKIDTQKNIPVFHSILLDQIDAVDTTAFYFNNYWWLFFTTQRHDSCTNLFAYYAKELTGPYHSHKNNPIKTDICSARPAGTPFIKDSILYRPTQDCSETYGGKINIMKVTALTPEKFSEEFLKSIPAFKGHPYNMGIHTISAVEEYTLVDIKKHSFIFSAMIRTLKRKLSLIN